MHAWTGGWPQCSLNWRPGPLWFRLPPARASAAAPATAEFIQGGWRAGRCLSERPWHGQRSRSAALRSLACFLSAGALLQSARSARRPGSPGGSSAAPRRGRQSLIDWNTNSTLRLINLASERPSPRPGRQPHETYRDVTIHSAPASGGGQRAVVCRLPLHCHYGGHVPSQRLLARPSSCMTSIAALGPCGAPTAGPARHCLDGHAQDDGGGPVRPRPRSAARNAAPRAEKEEVRPRWKCMSL